MQYKPGRLIVLSFAIGVSLLASHSAEAATIVLGPAVPLTDLLSGGTLTAGDKDFSAFTYMGGGDNPTASAVNVIPIMDSDNNFGIRFEASFVDLSTSSGPSDFLFTYLVTPTGLNQQISDAHLEAIPGSVAGTGFATVSESFVPRLTDVLLNIFDLEPGQSQLSDDEVFATPLGANESIPVQVDGVLFAGSDPSQVSWAQIDQTFSQVPEPGSVFLLGLMISGLAVWRRDRFA